MPPVRKELTAPNQRWCWDISYLMTFQKGVYLYLYLLLDECSRKVLQWRIDWTQTAEESRLSAGGRPERIKTSWTCPKTSGPSSTIAAAR